jgi:hypothetical protein
MPSSSQARRQPQACRHLDGEVAVHDHSKSRYPDDLIARTTAAMRGREILNAGCALFRHADQRAALGSARRPRPCALEENS